MQLKIDGAKRDRDSIAVAYSWGDERDGGERGIEVPGEGGRVAVEPEAIG